MAIYFLACIQAAVMTGPAGDFGRIAYAKAVPAFCRQAPFGRFFLRITAGF